MKQKPLIIIGAGGHAKVVLDTALCLGRSVIGLADVNGERHGSKVLGVAVSGDDAWVQSHAPNTVTLAMGIGSIADTGLRRRVFEAFVAKGYDFAVLIHPSAVIGRDVELGAGTVVMAGAVIQPGCRVGQNAIVNTGAQIDHGGRIGAHTHIAPGTVLSGNVTVGAGVHVGTGATVIQGICIGNDCVIAAGALVIQNSPDNSMIMGIPGREIQR